MTQIEETAQKKKLTFDVEELLSKMTLEQKVALLAGQNNWSTQPIPEHGIPTMRLSDGPNGLRGTRFFKSTPSACLPCGTAMGATFDPELLIEAGRVLANEAKAKGVHVVLGPTANIQRSPLGGRGFESFSEDPYLSGSIASAVIKGMQDEGILATMKHFVCNDQEDDRRAYNAIVSDRAFREIYLLPFQLAMRDAMPGCIMTSYNRVNGTHASQSKKIIKDILRDEWKYDGLVMSDWFGTYSIEESVKAGLNLEMPGPTIYRGDLLKNAVLCRTILETDVDDNARWVLKTIKRAFNESGIPAEAPEGEHDTEEVRQMLRKIAGNTLVLLKNKNSILPLPKNKKTAIIGPNAKIAAYCGGGSASLHAYYAVTPYEGVKAKVDDLQYALGLDTSKSLPLLGEHLITKDGKKGFYMGTYDGPQSDKNRRLVDENYLTNSSMSMSDYKPDIGEKDTFYCDVEGYFVPESDGEYEFGVSVVGSAQLFVDGALVVDNTKNQKRGTAFMGAGTIEEKGSIALKKGQKYKVTVAFGGANTSTLGQGSTIILGGACQIGFRKIESIEETLAEAERVAKEVDQVILSVGLTKEYESEGFDRTHMDLPEHVDKLVDIVTKANPNTVVVLQSGTPVSLPWIEKVPALVQAWYGGNETGNAIADVVFGDVNPSGKLSLTYPKRVEDNPAYLTYSSENGETIYGENVHVGYRYYEATKREPLFPFGFGLSYTDFTYGQVSAKQDGDNVTFSVEVTNKGSVAGKEAVQFYVSQKNPSILRPVKELKAFAKVDLAPGETKVATATIPLKYATSYWDTSKDKWISEKDVYTVHAASSSETVLSTVAFETEKTFYWNGL
ncbi:hypothetical protein TRVA0_010S02410 [Trichomonascus vanleenenianus]|uniref:beta-glucosidase H n=1 Tax=Trichomonascus vanleenenianus TaxID=2268995 RepID=UPI003ECAA829